MQARELVDTMFNAIDACQFDTLMQVMHPDAVYERPGYPPCVGMAEILHFYHHVRILRDGKHQLFDFVAQGHNAMSCGHFAGRKKDETAVDIQFSELYRFQDGKIIFRRSYFFTPAV